MSLLHLGLRSCRIEFAARTSGSIRMRQLRPPPRELAGFQAESLSIGSFAGTQVSSRTRAAFSHAFGQSLSSTQHQNNCVANLDRDRSLMGPWSVGEVPGVMPVWLVDEECNDECRCSVKFAPPKSQRPASCRNLGIHRPRAWPRSENSISFAPEWPFPARGRRQPSPRGRKDAMSSPLTR